MVSDQFCALIDKLKKHIITLSESKDLVFFITK